jgi:uncharacterized protein DUF4328
MPVTEQADPNPYRSPGAKVDASDAPLSARTRSTKGMLLIYGAVAVLSVVLEVFSYVYLGQLASGVRLAGISPELFDRATRILAFSQLAVFLVTGVLILRWIYRARKCVDGLSAVGLRFSPGWSIGWYFIPFANLWKPFQAMNEIWKASCAPQAWSQQPTPGLLRWWWTLWLLASFLGQAVSRLSPHARTLEHLQGLSLLSMATSATHIALAATLTAIVARIDSMQRAHFAELRYPVPLPAAAGAQSSV